MSHDVPASRHLVAGFLGGLTSAVCLQPLDLIKTRVQQSKNNSISSVLKNTSSITDLWRGTVPSALRTSIGSALYLSSLNFVRTQMAIARKRSHNSLDNVTSSSKLPKLPVGDNLVAGMITRASVGFIMMPITVLKVRYESDFYHYNSMAEGALSIYRKEGLRSFFSGFGATCLRDAPYAGLYMAFYEKNKALFTRLANRRAATANHSAAPDMLPASESALVNSGSAVLAAFFATAVTGPFDTIKTNMQLAPHKYRTFGGTALSLVRDNWRRLFDGLSLRLLRKAGSAGIAWCIYEEILRL